MRRPTDDFEEIQLSGPADARRSTNSLGDRLIVGLAALVLLVGVMIAGGNLLKGFTSEDEAALASATPLPSGATPGATPTGTPRPTATPRPPRQVAVVERTPHPAPDHGQEQSMAWMELLSEVPAFSGPSESNRVLDTLPAGAVLLVTVDTTQPGWAQMADPLEDGYMGWIATRDPAGNPVAVLHPADVQRSAGDIMRVWPAAGGYVAMGYVPADAQLGWWPRLFASPDGEHWQLADMRDFAQADVGSWQMADGPSGLLAMSGLQTDSGVWLSESGDGRSWSVVGSLDRLSSGWPNQMAGSGIGYLIDLGDSCCASDRPITLWYSHDGIVWEESRVPLRRTDNAQLQLLGVNGGFVAWQQAYGPDNVTTSLAFSSTGRTWALLQMDDPAVRGQLQLASVGSTLLGVGTAVNGSVRAWRADITAGASMHLVRDLAAEAALAGMSTIQVVSDGAEAFALGYGATDYRPRLWRSGGGAWNPVTLPDPDHIGPTPRLGAVGPSGLVLVGTRPTAAGANPVFWHLRRSGTWAVERDPVVPVEPDPGPDQCGPLPTSALDFALLPNAWAPLCFGDQPMTFTAWSAACDWCNQGPDSGDTAGTPAWLMRWSSDVQLRPAKGDAWYTQEGLLDPGLPTTDWGSQWVRVTGHFADPASDTCAWGPDNADPVWQRPETAVTWCRQRFVITAIEAADGP